MSFNLLEEFKNLLTPDFTERAATHYNESGSNVSKAVSGLIPAILLGLTNRATTHSDSLLKEAHEASDNPSLNNLSSLFGANSSAARPGSGLLNNLFGSRQGGIAEAISSFAGIGKSTSNSLLSLLAPLALGLLGRHTRQNNLTGSGLSSLLTGQRSAFMNAIPSGLNIGNLLNIGNDASHSTETVRTHTDRDTHRDDTKKPNWLPWLLGLAGLAW